MNEWIALKQALTAVDVVMRQWARELGLDGAELMVVLLLGEKRARAAADLAYFSGRVRQSVQRTLEGLMRAGLVRPAARSHDRVQAWELTEDGLEVLARLRARTEVWRELISSRVVLADLVQSLRWTVEAMVNRPSADGWGLLVPDVVRKDPEWDRSFSREEADGDPAEDASVEPLDSTPLEPQVTELVSVSVEAPVRARGNAPNISEAERDAIAKQFHEMWHRWG